MTVDEYLTHIKNIVEGFMGIVVNSTSAEDNDDLFYAKVMVLDLLEELYIEINSAL